MDKIKRITRQIPFGYKQSEEDQNYIEPIESELEALEQAKKYLKTCSLRETAQWLHRKTGRYISHVGLKNELNEVQPPKPKRNQLAEAKSL